MPNGAEVRAQMLQMITGYWVTQVVRGAAQLSLAEHLRDHEMSDDQIAQRTRMHPAAISRFLRACAALGLVARRDGRYASTELLQTLHGGSSSLRGLALAQSAPGHWLPWGQFLDALRTGERQTVSTLGLEIFDYYKVAVAEGADFTDAMSGLTTFVSDQVVELLDTEPYSAAVDVGGAGGALVASLMRKNTRLKGIVFDLPGVVSTAGFIGEEPASGRVELIGGDFFKAVPSGDLYLLKHILHDWADHECVAILNSCRRAAQAGAKLVVIEHVIEPEGTDPFAPLMDLNMMVLVTGRERTLPEYQALFNKSGWGEIKVIRTNTSMQILTADQA